MGTSVHDKSVLCSVRPGASAQRGRGRGASPARESLQPLRACVGGTERAISACVCVCVCEHPPTGRAQ